MPLFSSKLSRSSASVGPRGARTARRAALATWRGVRWLLKDPEPASLSYLIVKGLAPRTVGVTAFFLVVALNGDPVPDLEYVPAAVHGESSKPLRAVDSE